MDQLPPVSQGLSVGAGVVAAPAARPSTGTTDPEDLDANGYRSPGGLIIDGSVKSGLVAMNPGFCSKGGPDPAKIDSSEMIPDSGTFGISRDERMSPCYGNFYATLTSMKPLPPISTVSEKFGGLASGNAASGFVFMPTAELEIARFNSGANTRDGITGGTGDDCTFYKYHKENEAETTDDCISFDAMDPVSPGQLLGRVSNRGYDQSRGLPYASSFNHAGVSSLVKSEGAATSNDTLLPYSNYASNLPVSVVPVTMRTTSQTLMSATSGSQAVTSVVMQPLFTNQQRVLDDVSSLHQPQMQPLLQQNCVLGDDVLQHHMLTPTTPVLRSINTSPIQDQPSSSTDSQEELRQEIDEINTREIALKISNELKKYSIPQAVFAQRILGRSQGTLSDLLRNPKPWSKLKSGRETFRRMWKWLEDSEYQRLAQLRMSGGLQSFPAATTTDTPSSQSNQPTAMASKQARDSLPSRPDNSGPLPTSAKKPRMVFTEIQRRTLVAIFKEIKRPSKEIQATIAEQLGLKVSTVVNFFMNARRRSVDKYIDDLSDKDAVNNTVSSTANSTDDSTGQ